MSVVMRNPDRKKKTVTPKPPGTTLANPECATNTIRKLTARSPSSDGMCSDGGRRGATRGSAAATAGTGPASTANPYAPIVTSSRDRGHRRYDRWATAISFAYRAAVSSASRSDVKLRSTLRRPYSPICARSCGSRSSVRRFAASPRPSPSADSSPLLPCSTISGAPPLSSASTGFFIAIASTNTNPNGSTIEGSAKTSQAAIRAGMSVRWPVKMTLSDTPSSCASVFSSSVKLVRIACRSSRPMTSSERREIPRESPPCARMTSSWPLPRNRRAAHATTGALCRYAELPPDRPAVQPEVPVRQLDRVQNGMRLRPRVPVVDQRLDDELRDGRERVDLAHRPAQPAAHPLRTLRCAWMTDFAPISLPSTAHDTASRGRSVECTTRMRCFLM